MFIEVKQKILGRGILVNQLCCEELQSRVMISLYIVICHIVMNIYIATLSFNGATTTATS